jgi:hypothetical protein
MPLSNRERVGKAMDLLAAGLQPLVERELKAVHADRWQEAAQWLIVPGQSKPDGDLEWTDLRLQGQDTLAVRAAKKLRNEELLLTQLGGARLRHEALVCGMKALPRPQGWAVRARVGR